MVILSKHLFETMLSFFKLMQKINSTID